MKKVYDFNNYKDFLKYVIKTEKSVLSAYKKKLASAMSAPASFLSQVLHGKADLSLDHAHALARFWRFSDTEQEYFLSLVQLSRAATGDLKKYLENKIKKMQKAQENIATRLQQQEIKGIEQQLAYYSTWQTAAIHLLLGVPNMNTEESISNYLRISRDLVGKTLQELERIGLVERVGASTWKRLQGSIHLNKETPISQLNHIIWRNKAIQSLQDYDSKNFYYSAIHTISRADAEDIKRILLEAIDKTRLVIEPSAEEELVCLNCDFFVL